MVAGRQEGRREVGGLQGQAGGSQARTDKADGKYVNKGSTLWSLGIAFLTPCGATGTRNTVSWYDRLRLPATRLGRHKAGRL